MHILQISNKAPYPPNDGSSIAMYNMAKGFIQNNAQLHLLTINTKKHFKPDNELPEFFRQKSNYKSVYRNTDVTPYGAVLNLFSRDSFFISRFIFKEFEEEMISCLTKNKIDVVQIEGIFMAPYIPVIRRYSTAKIAIRTHNAEHIIWDRLIGSEKNAIKKQYLKLQNKRLKNAEIKWLKEADAIIPITNTDKEIFEKLNIKTPYFTSPTGIDLERYEIKNELTRQNTFFHLGSMDWMPNIEGVDWFLNEVYEPFLKKQNKLKFILAGRFMPERFFEKRDEQLSILEAVEDNIHFYNQHEIMLVPLQSGSGMRIKIIEGLAMGKVIISTSIGAEGIPVQHNEHIIIADTPKEFAQAIQQISGDEALKTKISNNARRFIAEHFNNTKLVEELITFYKNI